MTAQSQIKEKLVDKIDSASKETLAKLLDFLNELEEKSKKERILAFSGIWKDLEDETFNDLTIDLHKRRDKDVR